MSEKVLEFERLIKAEVIQRREEGCDVREIEGKLLSLREKDCRDFDSLYDELQKLNPVQDFPFKEPLTFMEIKASKPRGSRSLGVTFTEEELLDRIHGAWLGRCAGCLLGKPVEGWSRERIEAYLGLADAYPLSNYFPVIKPIPEGYPASLMEDKCTLGNIEYMVRDDDIDYTVMGLHILESRGLTFTTEDVGFEWLTHIPYLCVYTAESMAYRNLVLGLQPPATATYRNPYREWIGAQIRADMWGYVTPEMPELGAEFAYRDASLSHVKNGVYGAMFVSAMLSAAFAVEDLEEVVRIGLSEIPKGSRLSEAIRDTMDWSRSFSDWRQTWVKVMGKYGRYHPVHTINNVAMVVIGLLYGGGDFEKSIATSVMCGLDTDCNGATTGSILGMLLGAKKLPRKWTSPLNDRVLSYVSGFDDSRISTLAERTVTVAKANSLSELG